MTANDYSIEKYVSEYLKPLEEKGIITDLRVIPCRCRIMFRLNEPSRENSMKVIIETEADEDHITFFKSDVSVEETFRSPERRFIYQRLMAANKSINDELNRKSVNTDLYITKYLKPLEEKGLIQNIHADNDSHVSFDMTKKVKGMTASARITPGEDCDSVFLHIVPIGCWSTYKIFTWTKNEFYIDDLRVCLVNLMDNLDELL